MADKIENLDVFYEAMNQTITYTIITHDDGSQTSMPKSVYDTLPSELSTPTTPQAGA
jgi:uncharacterized repeat protein (TIGR01451 family)